MPRQRQALAEYLSTRPGRNRSTAWCCHAIEADVLAEIEATVARTIAAGHPANWAGITEWLRENGHPEATRSRVIYHFDRAHHAR